MTTPLLCVALAFVTIWLPKGVASYEQSKLTGGYDNDDPRVQRKQLSGRGARAQAAHENGIEAFPPFAAAVFVSHLAGGDPSIATYLAITFVAARTLYPLAYLSGIGWLRTIVFSVGMAATSALFLLPYYG